MSMTNVLILLFGVVTASGQKAPSLTQLTDFKKNNNSTILLLTTNAGAPVEVSDTDLLNSNLLSNEYYLDGIQSAIRERIPERAVHALGAGATGYFETTNDISSICKAKLFSKVGKKTPIAVRFSLASPKSGAPDTSRGSRGFAVKFYTEEGNFDIIGSYFPVFTFKNPSKATALIHIAKKNPVTNLPDPTMLWDFVTLNPESIYNNMYGLSDYGLPASYADMTGHSIHTYQVYNEDGVSSYVRFHIIPTTGAKYLNATEARKVATSDPDYYARGLYDTIASGKYPTYDLCAQILSDKDRKKADMDIFDITRQLDVNRYPLTKIGTITLNKNVQNYFADVESLAFSPGNFVPGILGAPDKMFEARRFTYRDAQIYRLGSNFKKIPVNCPINSPVFNYIRDGVPPLNDNGGDRPNYYPNSFYNAIPYEDKKRPKLLKIHEQPANNFQDAGNFYANVLTPSQQTTLVDNFVAALCSCDDIVKNRAIYYFKIIHIDFGNRVAKNLADKCV